MIPPGVGRKRLACRRSLVLPGGRLVTDVNLAPLCARAHAVQEEECARGAETG